MLRHDKWHHIFPCYMSGRFEENATKIHVMLKIEPILKWFKSYMYIFMLRFCRWQAKAELAIHAMPCHQSQPSTTHLLSLSLFLVCLYSALLIHRRTLSIHAHARYPYVQQHDIDEYSVELHAWQSSLHTVSLLENRLFIANFLCIHNLWRQVVSAIGFPSFVASP